MLMRRLLVMLVAAAGLTGCAALPEEWRESAARAGTEVEQHLICAGDGILEIALGSLEGGLEGAAFGAHLSAQAVGGPVREEAALIVIGGGAAVGGAIGVGAGMGGELLTLDETYTRCLKVQDTKGKPKSGAAEPARPEVS